MAVTGACFDNAPFAAEQETLRWLKFREAKGGGWAWRDGVLQHLAFPTGTTAVGRVTSEGMAAALARATAFASDVVLSFGGTAFELQMRHALKAQGAKTVFYLANPNYRSTTASDGVDAILTDSVAAQDLYQPRHGLASDMIGKFIRRPAVSSAAGLGVITFVNPSYEKGVTLFYRIVEMMRDVLPVAWFLVVESRATLTGSRLRQGCHSPASARCAVSGCNPTWPKCSPHAHPADAVAVARKRKVDSD